MTDGTMVGPAACGSLPAARLLLPLLAPPASPTVDPRFCISSVLSGAGAHLVLRAPSTAATVASGEAAHSSCSMPATAASYRRPRCQRNSQALGPSRYSTCGTWWYMQRYGWQYGGNEVAQRISKHGRAGSVDRQGCGCGDDEQCGRASKRERVAACAAGASSSPPHLLRTCMYQKFSGMWAWISHARCTIRPSVGNWQGP